MGARTLSEKAWTAQVVQIARLLGYIVYHTFDSRHSEAGFPDLCMARPLRRDAPARLIFAELKSARGKVSESQARWLVTLSEAGAETYVWRPCDAQEVADILAA